MTQGVGCLFGEFESTRWTVKKELGPHHGDCFSAGARHPPQIGPRCPSRPLHGFRLTNLEKSKRKKFAGLGGLAERCRAGCFAIADRSGAVCRAGKSSPDPRRPEKPS
jgi:hypothetical protein